MGIDIPNTNRTFRSRQGLHFDSHCRNLFIFHHWVGYSLKDASNNGVINIPIEMLCDHSAGRVMQDVYTFAGTDHCQLPEYGPYSYICKSIY